MKVNSVSFSSNQLKNQKSQQVSFGTAFVTVSEKNLGRIIASNVDEFNNGEFAKMYAESIKKAKAVIDKILKTMPGRISSVKDLTDKVDMFVLAAGSGSRFAPLAKAVADLKGKGESFNKISLPFEIGNGYSDLKMLDVPLATNKFFAEQTGYRTIMNPAPTGSFGDIVLHYLDPKNPVKDVIVSCGDNVFDAKAENLLEFFVETINNPVKQLGLVGVERTPQDVAKKFGVLKVGVKSEGSDVMSLNGFTEKPPIEEAMNLVTPNGMNIANTGMFVIKKEAMEALLAVIRNEIKNNGASTVIAKDSKEVYDFANAVKWVHSQVGNEASDVKIVKTWEDVGEPEAYKRWLDSMKTGSYLKNFSGGYRDAIQQAVTKRVGETSIQFTTNPKAAQKVDNLDIIG